MSNLKKFSSKDKPKVTGKEQTKQIERTEKIQKKDFSSRFDKYYKYLPWVLVIITFIIFYKSLNCDFLNWDDDRYVTGNLHIQLTWQNVKFFFTHYYFVMYIPFTMISYMIDYSLAGMHAWAFHLHNLILHLVNTVLVFYLVKKIFAKYDKSTLIAFLSALLFAIHPMHVESVVWIAERKDVLYSFYFLLSLISYIQFIETQKKKYLILSFLLYVPSLLAKTQAVVLPLAMILIDYLNRDFLSDKEKFKTFLKFDKKQWTIFAEKIPFLLLSLVFAYVAINAYASGTNVGDKFGQHRIALQTGYNFVETIVLVSYSLFLYVVKLFVPFKQSGIHPYPFDHGNMPSYFYFYTLFSLLYLGVIIWAWIKEKKILFFSLSFFFATIFIVLKIKNFVISEHYEYLPAIGIFTGISFYILGNEFRNNNLKKIVYIITLIWIVFLGLKTFNRIDVYKNSATFWQDIKSKYPKVIVAYYNNANYLQALGDRSKSPDETKTLYLKAIDDYLETIKMDSTYVGAYSNAGITYAKLRKYDDAVSMFNKAISLDTTQATIYSNRGNVLALLGKWQEAINDYNKALSLKPAYVDALYNRGVAYLNTGQYDESINDFAKVLELNDKKIEARKQLGLAYYYNNMPNECIENLQSYLSQVQDDEAEYFLALAYEKTEKSEEAAKIFKSLNNPDFLKKLFDKVSYLETMGDKTGKIAYYKLAEEELKNILKIDGGNSTAYMRLGVLQAKQNRLSQAIIQLNKAIELDENNQEAYANRGYAYFLNGDFNKALKDFDKALKLNPDDAVTYFNLGVLYEKNGNLSKSLDNYTKVIELEKNNYFGYFRRGLILLKLGKKNEACKDFKTAYNLGYTVAKDFIDKYCVNGQ